MSVFNLPVRQQQPQMPLPVQPATAVGAPAAPVAYRQGEAVGFYTDTTVCIGCKACEVACKEWNQLPSTNGGAATLSGQSYDNTLQLSGTDWRHVKFIEQFSPDRKQQQWLMMSDVCKHCVQAGCLEACPTGAIFRSEFDTVVIQADVCNGCRYCIGACPFDVIGINPVTNTAQKCTLCYDRLQAGMTPACAQACPTASIQFGPIEELRRRADQRVATLQATNVPAYIYGKEDILGGLNSFYLLVDRPSVYGLPESPRLPSRNVASGWGLSALSAAVVGVLGLLNFRKRRMDEVPTRPAEPVGAGEGDVRDREVVR